MQLTIAPFPTLAPILGMPTTGLSIKSLASLPLRIRPGLTSIISLFTPNIQRVDYHLRTQSLTSSSTAVRVASCQQAAQPFRIQPLKSTGYYFATYPTPYLPCYSHGEPPATRSSHSPMVHLLDVNIDLRLGKIPTSKVPSQHPVPFR